MREKGRRSARRLAVVLALVMLVPAGSAQASVSIGSSQVVVSGPAGRAIVERSPFRLRFEDATGQPALRELTNERPGPLVVPPVPEPQPLGFENLPNPTLYSPLSFMVGAQATAQYPAAFPEGNMLIGAAGGIQFSARDVLDAAAEGDGARLTVSTSDPTGRRLVVRVSPGPGSTFRVRATPTPSDGVGTMSDSFATDAREAFHGFGGRHNSIDERGQDFYNWIEQENVSPGPFQAVPDAIPGSGGQTYLFPNGPTAAYYAQSLFVSSRPYGFLLNQPELSRFRLASERADAWQVAVAAAALDYTVALGPGSQTIRSLTQINGRQRVPPNWAAGTQFDRLVRVGPLGLTTTDDGSSYGQAVDDDIRNIARYGLPVDAYRLEGWPLLSRQKIRDVVSRLHGMGIHALLYFRPFVSEGGAGGTEDPDAYAQAIDGGYVATRADGGPYLFLANFGVARTAMIDFTNPRAVAWWRGRIREALDLGADGFMQDFGEQVLADMHFSNGETGASMHNRYPVLYHRVTREILDEYERQHPGRSLYFFTRAGYSGEPGSAAYESANFPGDETTDWSRSAGLRSIVSDMLNRAIGGAYGYTMDIGGYVDTVTPPTTKELFIRWAEMAALSPLFRLHGSAGAGTHTPWSYDDETVRIYKQLSELHLRARPLILKLWRAADRTGMPVTRPLWLAYPGDERAAAQDQEWLLGSDVLVAPVVEEGATSRSVYFPRGCWRHPETGLKVNGPKSQSVPAPLASLPYFFRCGTSPFEQAARPRLALRVRRVSRGLRVSLAGPDRRAIRRVDFVVDGRLVGRDRRAPFTKVVRVRSGRAHRIRALAVLRDGRRLSYHRTARR